MGRTGWQKDDAGLVKADTKAVAKRGSFEIPPRPIPEKDIKEKIGVDVVVAGAGIAGLSAALSAAEAGAKVALTEKSASFNCRGLHNAAISSRLQKREGMEVDANAVVQTIMHFGTYKGNQKLVKLWADNCGKAMDWLLDMADAAGIEVVLDTTTKPWYFPNYPLAHLFLPGLQNTLAQMLLDNCEAKGVRFFFETPAARLIRKKRGRVTGIIAQDKAGDYVQFDAAKGVILCTGDYGGDREMVRKYCESPISSLKCAYEDVSGKVNTGDGLKMALWIGAAVDEPNHMAMLFDWTTWGKRKLFNLGRQPWLYVNCEGDRFMNEDLPWGLECNQLLRQPDGCGWAVWDARFDEQWPRMRSQCCKNMGAPSYLWDPAQLTKGIERGVVFAAPALDELAQKIGVPVAAFRATVTRYNELARIGKDLDFGKYHERLTSIETPPFYATQYEARYLVIVGGLRINTNLQVLGYDRKAIPGLYAAGNVSGDFFGSGSYPTNVSGVSHSRAFTFGRLAGLQAAAETG